MSIVYIARKGGTSFWRHVPNLVSRLQSGAVRALRYFSSSSRNQRTWYTLDEHLLRDIGMTAVDAEIARLRSRMGVAETQRETRTPDQKS
jgi:hypothetical protein